jgi:hypothetical protein
VLAAMPQWGSAMSAQMSFEIAATDHNESRGIVGERRPAGTAMRNDRVVRQPTK